MTLETRFEYKYVLCQHRALRVRGAIAPYFRKDRVSLKAPGGKYLVRSLYFDTHDYLSYFEKMAGETARRKLRLRSYWDTAEDAAFINVEQKFKVAKHTFKAVGRVDAAEIALFMATGIWQTKSDTLDEFSLWVKRETLRPKTLVFYRREGFDSRDGSGVRLTLDSDLAYADSDNLFLTHDKLRNDLSRKIVLEIKTRRDDISWLNRLVRDLDLGAEPNSKYTDSVEHTQRNLWL